MQELDINRNISGTKGLSSNRFTCLLVCASLVGDSLHQKKNTFVGYRGIQGRRFNNIMYKNNTAKDTKLGVKVRLRFDETVKLWHHSVFLELQLAPLGWCYFKTLCLNYLHFSKYAVIFIFLLYHFQSQNITPQLLT